MKPINHTNRRRLISTVTLLFFLSTLFAGLTPRDKQTEKAEAEKLIGKLPVKFMENKGQLRDIHGNAIPYAWFKASAPGLDLYLTETGLTYVFLRVEEAE